MIKTKSYAALDAASPLVPYEIQRREPGPDDVQIEILYCGVCFNLILKRRQLAGPLIGGMRETREVLDFCAQLDIVSDIELMPMNYINTVYQRMLKSDVKYRFVIDMATL